MDGSGFVAVTDPKIYEIKKSICSCFFFLGVGSRTVSAEILDEFVEDKNPKYYREHVCREI